MNIILNCNYIMKQQEFFLQNYFTFYEDIIIIKRIIICKPYKRVGLNNLDSQSSNVCGFSIVLGMQFIMQIRMAIRKFYGCFYLFMGIFYLQYQLEPFLLIYNQWNLNLLTFIKLGNASHLYLTSILSFDFDSSTYFNTKLGFCSQMVNQ
ncbi:hypothetical protein pb186bvf_018536 [Paramecium bursaria]